MTDEEKKFRDEFFKSYVDTFKAGVEMSFLHIKEYLESGLKAGCGKYINVEELLLLIDNVKKNVEVEVELVGSVAPDFEENELNFDKKFH